MKRNMFFVLLIQCECCVLCCPFVLQCVFGTVKLTVDYLLPSHSPLSIPKCFYYVRNVASPNMLFIYFLSTTWFSCL